MLASPRVLAILIDSQPAFLVLDLEHGSWDKNQLGIASDLIHNRNLESILRVPSASVEYLQLGYDLSFDYIQVSGIRTQSDLDKLSSRHGVTPEGHIGYSPWTRRGLSKSENRIPEIIIQIEHQDSIRLFLDGDLVVPSQIKNIFIGRYDWSASLGIKGDISNEKIMRQMGEVVVKSSELGLQLWTIAKDLSDAEALINIGITKISIGSDVSRLLQLPGIY